MTAPGTLYLIPNALDFGVESDAALSDTLPSLALQTAARLTHWVAENAKTTRAFLKRVDTIVPLSNALQSLKITELPRPPKGRNPATTQNWHALLQPALDGHDIGLISEAGLPAIADPGAGLVQAAHDAGMKVVALSGPSSLLLALGASGLNGQSFAFVGYLPVDAAARNKRLRELEAHSRREQQTQLVIETPYRNDALMHALQDGLQSNTRLSVSCGLTLPNGWTRTARVAQWKQHPQNLPNDVPAVFCFLAEP